MIACIQGAGHSSCGTTEHTLRLSKVTFLQKQDPKRIHDLRVPGRELVCTLRMRESLVEETES